MYKISVENREPRAQSNFSLRKQGLVPAIYYHHNEESMPLVIKLTDFKKFLGSHKSLLQLSNGKMAVLKGIDRNYHGDILHLNLEGVVHGETFHKKIPLHIVFDEDQAPWRREGMILLRKISEVEIETTPENVPEFLEISVDKLTKDEVIRIKDIQVEGFKIIDDPEHEVAMLTYPQSEPAAPAPSPANSGPEDSEAAEEKKE